MFPKRRNRSCVEFLSLTLEGSGISRAFKDKGNRWWLTKGGASDIVKHKTWLNVTGYDSAR